MGKNLTFFITLLIAPLTVLHATEADPVSPAPNSTDAAEQDSERTFKRDELKVPSPTVPGLWPKNHEGWSIADLSTFQRLFSLMDLERPELGVVKQQVDRGDYAAAMEVYTRGLAERLAKLPREEEFEYWLYGAATADELIEGKLKTAKYGEPGLPLNINIGKPGQINFFKAASDDYRTTIRDISGMNWVAKYAAAYQKTRDPKYLNGWLATWEDFALNWSDQYAATRKDPEIWGRLPSGHTKVRGIDWVIAQLYLAWRLQWMHDGLVSCLQTAREAGQVDEVDPLALARILISVATGDAQHARRWLPRAEQLVPNQIRGLAREMFTWGVHFPEFHAADWWREETIPIFTLTNNPDGTDREHSLNYFQNNLEPLLTLLRQLPAAEQDHDLITALEAKSTYRDRFIPSIARPDGFTPPVGNPNIWRNYGQSCELKASAFNSVLFPYGGFAVQRSGWKPESLYLFMKQNRPSIGHWRPQDGSLQLSAYGRNLLISSVGEMYSERGGWKSYWMHAAGQNMILVDGMSPERRKSGFEQLDPWLWHISENIEFMETETTGPYSGRDFRIDGVVSDEAAERHTVTDVTHRRQVHFLKLIKCWIVTDRIDSGSEREFTQTWCFGPEFAEDQVIADSATHTIRTRQPDAPNLALHQFATPSLDYMKYFGVHNDKQILGWVGIFADRDKWQYTPAVDMHANWRSKGKQLLITLMVPSRDEISPIKSIQDAGKGSVQGFDAELTDGTRIFYRAEPEAGNLQADGINAVAKSLLVVSSGQGDQSGMVLGATGFNGKPAPTSNIEFQSSRQAMKRTPVTAPTGFRWKITNEEVHPVYRHAALRADRVPH